MYLVFGPNEMVTIAGRLEELATASDLTAAAVAYEVLRPAADRLMTALRPPDWRFLARRLASSSGRRRAG